MDGAALQGTERVMPGLRIELLAFAGYVQSFGISAPLFKRLSYDGLKFLF